MAGVSYLGTAGVVCYRGNNLSQLRFLWDLFRRAQVQCPDNCFYINILMSCYAMKSLYSKTLH